MAEPVINALVRVNGFLWNVNRALFDLNLYLWRANVRQVRRRLASSNALAAGTAA